MQVIKSDNILSVEDNIKKYTPELSDSDIKAFVWYNQTLGRPMTGWEKYFLPKKVTKRTCFLTEDTPLYSNTWDVIQTESKGVEIGIATRFEHSYNMIMYVAVRKFDNTIVLINKSHIKQSESTAQFDVKDLTDLVKAGSLYYINGDLMPLHVYSATPLSMIVDSWKNEAEFIKSEYGEVAYNAHKAVFSNITRLNIASPDESKKYSIDFRDQIFDDYTIISEKYLSFNTENRGSSNALTNAFLSWVAQLGMAEFDSLTKWEFRTFYERQNYRMGSGSAETKEDRQEEHNKKLVEAAALMDKLSWKFCVRELDTADIARLNEITNRAYNNSIQIDTSKIPVGFVSNKYFKGNVFSLKKVQVKAFKYAIARNSYTLALTVGFGKTSTMICLLSYYIGSGISKRPLVVVPKAVLNNWKRESNGYYTNAKKEITYVPKEGFEFKSGILTGTGIEGDSIHNLDVSIIRKIKTGSIKLSDNRFYTVTYEGFKNIRYKDDQLESILLSSLEILSGKRFESLAELQTFVDAAGRGEANAYQRIVMDIVKANMAIKSDSIFIEQLKFDAFIADEAHRFKNLFLNAGEDANKPVTFKNNLSKPSMNAMKGLMFFFYTKKNHNGVLGFLTATPFINNPLEIYTALMFANYSELVKNNVQSISAFAEMFFDETTEPAVNNNGVVRYKTVIKRFKNKQTLVPIIRNSILREDGDTVTDILRPCIIRYPNSDIKMVLKPSPLQRFQRALLAANKEQMDRAVSEISNSNDENLGGYIDSVANNFEAAQRGVKSRLGLAGKTMASSRASALSPFCNAPVKADFTSSENFVNMNDFYNYSPKIKFAIDLINDIKAYHESRSEKQSGILIYMGFGLEIIDLLVYTINNKCNMSTGNIRKDGVSYSEVETITGETTQDDRDAIQDLFNQGLIKVIIGTSSIREGMNLQENCATLINLTPDWNSTDVEQLEGRIHRQGNYFGYARIFTPLVLGTFDSFIYQKYEEKSKRIKDAFSLAGGTNVSDDMSIEISLEDQIKAITDSPIELTKVTVQIESKKLKSSLLRAIDKKKLFSESKPLIYRFNSQKDWCVNHIDRLYKEQVENLDSLKAIGKLIEAGNKSISKAQFESRFKNHTELFSYIEKAKDSKEIVDLINVTSTVLNRGKEYGFDLIFEDGQAIQKALSKPSRLIKSFGNLKLFTFIDGEYFSSGNMFNNFRQTYGEVKRFEIDVLADFNLSLESSEDEINELYQKLIEEVSKYEAIISKNFEIKTQEEGISLTAKDEYVDRVLAESAEYLAKENALAEDPNELIRIVGERTNVQLSYSLMNSDIDLHKCALPTTEAGHSIRIAEALPEPVEESPIAEPLQTSIPVMKAPAGPKPTIGTRLYDALDSFFGPNVSYKKFEIEGWNTFAIEKQDYRITIKGFDSTGSYNLILEDFYIQEGDLMSDPRIDVAVFPAQKIAIPADFTNSGIGKYEEYVSNGVVVNKQGAEDCAWFIINNWIPSLKDRGVDFKEVVIEKPSATLIATRIKLLTKQLARDPKNVIIKTRLKLLQKQK